MPKIEIDINKPKTDPTIIVLGEFELTVKPDFMVRDQKKFYELERDVMDPDVPKKQAMLLFDLGEKEFDKMAEKIPYQAIKEATMEGWSAVNSVNWAEKKTQELKLSKSSPPSPVYSPTEKSKESKATTETE